MKKKHKALQKVPPNAQAPKAAVVYSCATHALASLLKQALVGAWRDLHVVSLGSATDTGARKVPEARLCPAGTFHSPRLDSLFEDKGLISDEKGLSGDPGGARHRPCFLPGLWFSRSVRKEGAVSEDPCSG